MKKSNKQHGNPTDQMIQGNKEEADSMLSLWGKKPRRHIKQKPVSK